MNDPRTVRMGEITVAHHEDQPDGLAVRGLGSCIAVFIHDRRRGLGGIAHVMLPGPMADSPLTLPGRFAPTAVPCLVDRMLQKGARRHALQAKIFGGAHLFTSSAAPQRTLGERNIQATLKALAAESIPLVASDVGGTSGRSLVADLATGQVRVTGLRQSPKRF